MKHNVGDVVRIKSKEWYDENKNVYGNVINNAESKVALTPQMSELCGMVATIIEVFNESYHIDIDRYQFFWDDYMFEDSIEEHISEGIDIAEPLSPLKVIDWEQRRFDLAKCAMESLLTTTKIQEYENSHFELDVTEMAISDISVNVANEIIKKLKEMERVK
jgi:hypothetical protein